MKRVITLLAVFQLLPTRALGIVSERRVEKRTLDVRKNGRLCEHGDFQPWTTALTGSCSFVHSLCLSEMH